jgi:hypothetical protein
MLVFPGLMLNKEEFAVGGRTNFSRLQGAEQSLFRQLKQTFSKNTAPCHLSGGSGGFSTCKMEANFMISYKLKKLIERRENEQQYLSGYYGKKHDTERVGDNAWHQAGVHQSNHQ